MIFGRKKTGKMLNQDQILKQLHDIKSKFQSQIPIWLDQAIDKLAIRIIPKQNLDQVRQDMGMNTETKLQFLNAFPQAFLKKLTRHSEINKIQSVQQLLSQAQNFFKDNIPVVRKTQILKDILHEMNSNIQTFFRDHQQRIIELSNQEKLIRQQVIKLGKTQHIKNFITMDQKQRQIKTINQNNINIKRIKLLQKDISPSPTKSVINNSPIQQLTQCICNGNLKIIEKTQSSSVIICRVCNQVFHTICLKIQSNYQLSQFMCPKCIILRLDPFNHIVHVLCQPETFMPTQNAPTKSFIFQLGIQDLTLQLEIRCLKLDGKHGSEEITWPDVGELTINGLKVIEFIPLQKNSSLKKRRDEKLTIKRVKYNNTNIIQIREGVPTGDQNNNCRVQTGQVYFIGVFLVEALSDSQLINKCLRDEQTWISLQDCKEMIRLYMENQSSNDIRVDTLAINLTCNFDLNLIETPIRGNLCQHIQCFSLQNMIFMMNNQFPRRWKCPICKSKCFDFNIDTYQYLILKIIKQYQISLNECSFNICGNLEQEIVANFMNEENIDKTLPHFGVKNENKFIYLNSLRQNKESPNQINNLGIIEPKEQVKFFGIQIVTYEPSLKKLIHTEQISKQNTSAQISTRIQILDHAQIILKMMIQNYSEVKNQSNIINPVFID